MKKVTASYCKEARIGYTVTKDNMFMQNRRVRQDKDYIHYHHLHHLGTLIGQIYKIYF